eukprot:14674441-Heterocapsa_arctica.AAC.1
MLAGKAANETERLDKNPVQEKEDEYPGVSNKQQVRLRAEQLFQEGAAKKVARKQELLDSRQLKKFKQDQTNMEDRENDSKPASLQVKRERKKQKT